MSSSDSASQDTHFSTSYVSSIDISLASNSHKTINSIKLKKNDESLRDVQKTICAGGVHREEFYPPVALDPGEDHIHISLSVSYPSPFGKRAEVIDIDIDPRDIGCMREERGARSYRKKERKVEVVVAGHELVCSSPSIYTCPSCIWPVACDYNFNH
jgi:hypothetical protein